MALGCVRYEVVESRSDILVASGSRMSRINDPEQTKAKNGVNDLEMTLAVKFFFTRHLRLR